MNQQIDNIMKIVDGIDRYESEGGWWETSTGVRFGQGVKQALRAAIEQALSARVPDEREAFISWVKTAYPDAYSTKHAEHYWTHKHVARLAWEARAMLAAAPEAPQPQPKQPAEWVEDACARIKAADDAAADRDYMLDSNDCIAVLRGEWKHPLANDFPQPQPKQEPEGGVCARCGGLVFDPVIPPSNDWVGLTNPERAKILAAVPDVPFEGDWHSDLIDIIEAKLREKNGGGV